MPRRTHHYSVFIAFRSFYVERIVLFNL